MDSHTRKQLTEATATTATTTTTRAIRSDDTAAAPLVEANRYFNLPQHISSYLDAITYSCPVCHRHYPQGDWQGCHRHLQARKHGNYCLYSSESDDVDDDDDADRVDLNDKHNLMVRTEKALIVPSLSHNNQQQPSTLSQ